MINKDLTHLFFDRPLTRVGKISRVTQGTTRAQAGAQAIIRNFERSTSRKCGVFLSNITCVPVDLLYNSNGRKYRVEFQGRIWMGLSRHIQCIGMWGTIILSLYTMFTCIYDNCPVRGQDTASSICCCYYCCYWLLKVAGDGFSTFQHLTDQFYHSLSSDITILYNTNAQSWWTNWVIFTAQHVT